MDTGQKITDMLSSKDIDNTLNSLIFIYRNSGDERIRRTAKSLFDLITRELYEKK